MTYEYIIILFSLFLIFVSFIITQFGENEEDKKYELCEKAEVDLITMLKRIGFEDKQIFYNLYVPNGENYTQIDVLVVCKIGIIVFEVKDFNGWIFGGMDEKYWHHTYKNQEKYKMYNPIIQNANHVSCLKKHFNNLNIFNVVVFFGNCELKNTKFLSSKSCVIYAEDLEKCIKYLYYHNKKDNEKIKGEYLIKLQEFMKNAYDEKIILKHKNYLENKKLQS